jgi:hypothetical protein
LGQPLQCLRERQTAVYAMELSATNSDLLTYFSPNSNCMGDDRDAPTSPAGGLSGHVMARIPMIGEDCDAPSSSAGGSPGVFGWWCGGRWTRLDRRGCMRGHRWGGRIRESGMATLLPGQQQSYTSSWISLHNNDNVPRDPCKWLHSLTNRNLNPWLHPTMIDLD